MANPRSSQDNNDSADVDKHIDPGQEQQIGEWARKLDATPLQIREAIGAVGNHADDVEMHLKGSRSTTNSERMKSASGSSNNGRER
jgi:hypothetical protein